FFIPRPPSLTLFPYTTLFRSGGIVGPLRPRPRSPPPGDGPLGGFLGSPAGGRTGAGRPVGRPFRCRALPGRAAAAGAEAHRRRLDRKSTRLNSSHVSSSYAVF